MTHRKTTRIVNRRAACALSSAAVVTALCGANTACGAVNSFFPGVSFANASFNDPANWSLGHVPNDATEEMVIPTGGQVNGAVTMTFNGGNVLGATLTHSGSSGRVLVNTSATPANLTLAGLPGKPVILNNTSAFQLTIGTDSINQLNLILSSTDNVFQNNAGNILRIFANIGETTPHTNVTINAPNSSGTFGVILGGNNTITGALTFNSPQVSLNFSGGNTLGAGSLVLNGGTINAIAAQGATATNNVLNQTVFNAGTTLFNFSSGGQAQNSIIDLGTLTRNPGATANLDPIQNTGGTLPSFRTTSTTLTNGILNGWMTTQTNLPNNFVYDWATVDVNRNIIPFTTYNTKNDLSTWSTNDNINIDNASPANATPAVAINSLRTNVAGVYTITFGGATTINTGGILVQGNFGSTVTFAGAGPITSGTTDLMITLSGNTTAAAPKQLTISTPIVDRDATHPVGITKSHTGALIILGSHTFSGDVYINQGSLNIDTMGNIGDPSGLGTSGTIYVGSVGSAGTINFGSGGNTPVVGANTSNRNFVFGDGGANIRNQAGTIVLSGSMSGTSLTRFGTTGWTTISGSKTYTGPLTVGAGTLDVDVVGDTGAASGLGTGTNFATITMGSSGNGACLNYSGLVNGSTNRPIAFNQNNNQILRVENNTTPVNLTLTGAMSGTFSWQKLGTGTLTLSGSKTYSGTLTIGRGDLRIDNPGGLGTGAGGATITLGNSNTATLTFTGVSGTTSRPFTLNPQAAQFGAFEATVGALTLTGQIDTNGKALAFDGAGTINVNSPIIGGGGSLTKNGHGQLNLNGTNSYTGNTTIGGGTVVFAGATAWSPALNGPGVTTINGGRAVFDYSSGGNPSTLIQSSLMGSYPTFTTGQLRSTAADSRRGLGWADDGVSTVTVAYTYFGDANLDGVVNTSDFNVLAQNFNSTGSVWKLGDFNYDGKVNMLDFNAVATNFGATPITPEVGLGALVPEPGTIAFFAACGLALSRKRRRGVTPTPPSHVRPHAAREG